MNFEENLENRSWSAKIKIIYSLSPSPLLALYLEMCMHLNVMACSLILHSPLDGCIWEGWRIFTRRLLQVRQEGFILLFFPRKFSCSEYRHWRMRHPSAAPPPFHSVVATSTSLICMWVLHLKIWVSVTVSFWQEKGGLIPGELLTRSLWQQGRITLTPFQHLPEENEQLPFRRSNQNLCRLGSLCSSFHCYFNTDQRNFIKNNY